jgi:hypothetical protein
MKYKPSDSTEIAKNWIDIDQLGVSISWAEIRTGVHTHVALALPWYRLISTGKIISGFCSAVVSFSRLNWPLPFLMWDLQISTMHFVLIYRHEPQERVRRIDQRGHSACLPTGELFVCCWSDSGNMQKGRPPDYRFVNDTSLVQPHGMRRFLKSAK